MRGDRQGSLVARCLKTQQGKTDLYAFFIPGAEILRIADISRIERRDGEGLAGFQRPEIKTHVRQIVEYLDGGEVLFPNAVILALAPGVTFTAARGSKPEGLLPSSAEAGTLRIPIRSMEKAAWVVDGQQRSLALSQCQNGQLPVPVIAFVSKDLAVHREQFILVNKAKPLPTRLINELLPEVGSLLPRDLSPRRIPSELVNLLNTNKTSPFYKLIDRMSEANPDAVIRDTTLIQVIKNSIKSPLGALAPFKADGATMPDTDGMFRTMVIFWSAVRDAFPEAWGKKPTESRLMHSAGIEAMGYLMDRVMTRATAAEDQRAFVFEALRRIAPHCRWTSGRWEGLDRDWNDIQNTSQDVRRLSDHLIRLDHVHGRGAP